MAEWLFEAGIGEDRAALIEDGRIVEAVIEVDAPGLRAGAVVEARLRTGRIAATEVEEVLLDARPAGVSEGAAIRLLVTREALSEPGKPKRAKGRVVGAGTPLLAAPTLYERIEASGMPIASLGRHGADRLEDCGWSDVLEQAETGHIPFNGGVLTISLTPAMTLIDIDGESALERLMISGGRAAGEAIRRMGIAGSIGIDFPTVESRKLRQQAVQAVRETIHHPHEATAINGFGFMQIVRPRERGSLPELVQCDRVGAAARALVRRAKRSGLVGAVTLTAHSAVIAAMNSAWLERLASQLGGTVSLKSDPVLAMSAGHVSKT